MNTPLDLHLTLRDPLIFRDARPFAFGQRMKGLPWLTPGLLAGSLRSSLGKTAAQGQAFSHELRQALQALDLSPAFPCANGQIFFPAPLDVVATLGAAGSLQNTRLQLEALAQQEGVYPAPPTSGAFVKYPEGKRVPLPAWWRADHMAAWLAGTLKPADICSEGTITNGFWHGPTSETRTHVGMASSGTAAEGKLFQTQGMSFASMADGGAHDIELALRLSWPAAKVAESQLLALQEALDDASTWPRFVPLGGEHRPVSASAQKSAPSGWDCAPDLASALNNAKYVRMVLASPAYFKEGWKPSWLDAQGKGTPPGCKDLTLQLQEAIVPRWQAISGWSYALNAPKRTYRLVPAGAVYFFAVCEGDAAQLAHAWLRCVDDSDVTPPTAGVATFQDTLRGTGLGRAVWGVACEPAKNT
jgi:CRISPR-associated protein Cmr3